MRALLVFVFLLAWIRPVLADDKAAAEAAFLKGRDLMKAGQIAQACDAFARSQALDPQLGTQYNLALCYEKAGRWASAWALFREIAQRDANAARKKDSASRASALAPKLTKLLIAFEGAPRGLVVTRDGTDVTASVGIETPVDPGTYEVVARAPGYRDFTTQVTATGEGMTVTVTIPELEKLPEDAAPPDQKEEARVPLPGEQEPAPAPRTSGRGRTILGLSIAGGGVLLAGGGLVAGAMASSKWSDAKGVCGDDLVCDTPDQLATGNGYVSDARTLGNVSTVLVGVGAAAIAGGVILWLTAPSGDPGTEHALRIEPVVTGDGAFVSLSGVLP